MSSRKSGEKIASMPRSFSGRESWVMNSWTISCSVMLMRACDTLRTQPRAPRIGSTIIVTVAVDVFNGSRIRAWTTSSIEVLSIMHVWVAQRFAASDVLWGSKEACSMSRSRPMTGCMRRVRHQAAWLRFFNCSHVRGVSIPARPISWNY